MKKYKVNGKNLKYQFFKIYLKKLIMITKNANKN